MMCGIQWPAGKLAEGEALAAQIKDKLSWCQESVMLCMYGGFVHTLLRK